MIGLAKSPLTCRNETGVFPPSLNEFPGIANVLSRLIAYCEANRWQGHDPYDALNSQWLQVSPRLNRSSVRLVLTQLLKRSPVNLRAILRVPPTENPKTLALALSAYAKLAARNWPGARENTEYLVGRLAALSANGRETCCWGYSFPWQTRTVLVPRGRPNLVCTAFVANALLDTFELNGSLQCLQMAVGAAEYLSDELYWENGAVAGFSYPTPAVRTQVHNANLLGAALLCRTALYARQSSWLDQALKVARYSVSKQNPDGSWPYGEARHQEWIDNFHTGYNLSALQTIADCLPTDEFDDAIRRGFDFYQTRFFTPEGIARYYHNKTHPIDIHCVAQSLLTLTEFRRLNPEAQRLAGSIYRWTLKNMWDETGFFYYRKWHGVTIRTSFMRWSQAWMVLALATVLTSLRETSERILKPELAWPPNPHQK